MCRDEMKMRFWIKMLMIFGLKSSVSAEENAPSLPAFPNGGIMETSSWKAASALLKGSIRRFGWSFIPPAWRHVSKEHQDTLSDWRKHVFSAEKAPRFYLTFQSKSAPNTYLRNFEKPAWWWGWPPGKKGDFLNQNHFWHFCLHNMCNFLLKSSKYKLVSVQLHRESDNWSFKASDSQQVAAKSERTVRNDPSDWQMQTKSRKTGADAKEVTRVLTLNLQTFSE